MQIKYTMPSLKGYKRVERVVYNSSMISEEARRRKEDIGFLAKVWPGGYTRGIWNKQTDTVSLKSKTK